MSTCCSLCGPQRRRLKEESTMAYMQRWMDYFDLLDVDKNGVIDSMDLYRTSQIVQTEMDKYENSEEIQQAISAYNTIFNGFMEDFDEDKDGRVTKEDVLFGVQKHFIGQTLETIPAWWKESSKHMIEAADLDKDGELSLEETRRYLKMADPALSDTAIEASFAWVKGLAISNRFDATAAFKFYYVWATCPEYPPQLHPISAIFRKRAHVK
eukprot:Phypoly_transcript_12669.p1 GENE.Phypoly_transcript_12669~~Phypoly_transcript_12669.p1  ORF type:complete len:211 (+),score=33.99 Phypoly_transcript_12669:26-658(+)